MIITSSQNATLKLIKKICSNKKEREINDCYVVENKKYIDELIENKQELLYLVQSENANFNTTNKTIVIEHNLFRELFNKNNKSLNQIAIFKRPQFDISDRIKQAKRLLILDQIADPSNMGAIVRSAVAFDIDIILLAIGCADFWHTDSINASAANCYQIPVIALNNETQNYIESEKISLIQLNQKGDSTLNSIKDTNKIALVLGSEGHGIKNDWIVNYKNATLLKIETNSKIESLNVAVAAGIALAELYKIQK